MVRPSFVFSVILVVCCGSGWPAKYENPIRCSAEIEGPSSRALIALSAGVKGTLLAYDSEQGTATIVRAGLSGPVAVMHDSVCNHFLVSETMDAGRMRTWSYRTGEAFTEVGTSETARAWIPYCSPHEGQKVVYYASDHLPEGRAGISVSEGDNVSFDRTGSGQGILGWRGTELLVTEVRHESPFWRWVLTFNVKTGAVGKEWAIPTKKAWTLNYVAAEDEVWYIDDSREVWKVKLTDGQGSLKPQLVLGNKQETAGTTKPVGYLSRITVSQDGKYFLAVRDNGFGDPTVIESFSADGARLWEVSISHLMDLVK